jgi:pimeloyl-ACP methyl ester carboxylesterase
MQRLFLILFVLVLAPGCRPAPEPRAPAEPRTTAVDGTSIAYLDTGEGPHTLVLIHGLGSYAKAWSKNVGALAKEYRVIAVDLPGYGGSDKPDAPYSMQYFAEVLHGLLGQLDVHHPVLVGHSMGGQIAITYALLYPEEYSGLVLTSPAGLETFDDGEAKWLAGAVTPEFTCAASDEAIYTRHAQNFYQMPADAHFMVEDRIAQRSAKDFVAYCTAVSRSVAGMLDFPVADRLGEIGKKTLVLFGKYDNLIPNPFLHGGSTVKLVEKQAKAIPHGEIEIFENAGHFAQFEVAEAWNARVLRFLRSLPPPPPKQATPPPEPAPAPEAAVVEPDADATPAPDGEPEPELTAPETGAEVEP